MGLMTLLPLLIPHDELLIECNWDDSDRLGTGSGHGSTGIGSSRSRMRSRLVGAAVTARCTGFGWELQ